MLPGRAPWPDPKVRCGPQVGAGLFQALRDEVQPLAQVSGFPEQLLLNWVWPWEASSPNLCGRAGPGIGLREPSGKPDEGPILTLRSALRAWPRASDLPGPRAPVCQGAL